jgi:hypothetical protein
MRLTSVDNNMKHQYGSLKYLADMVWLFNRAKGNGSSLLQIFFKIIKHTTRLHALLTDVRNIWVHDFNFHSLKNKNIYALHKVCKHQHATLKRVTW